MKTIHSNSIIDMDKVQQFKETLSYSFFPAFFVIVFYVLKGLPPGIFDLLILFGFGLFSARTFNSALKDPTQFATALFERVWLIWALTLSISYRLMALFQLFIAKLGRIIIALVFSAIYGVSPIDLIPDIFLGLGWLDDIGVSLFASYWALFGGSIVMSFNLINKAEKILDSAEIKTPFP